MGESEEREERIMNWDTRRPKEHESAGSFFVNDFLGWRVLRDFHEGRNVQLMKPHPLSPRVQPYAGWLTFVVVPALLFGGYYAVMKLPWPISLLGAVLLPLGLYILITKILDAK